MKKNLLFSYLLLFVMIQVSFSQDFDFIQTDDADGLVVMEAENYTAIINSSGDDSTWHAVTTPADFSGASALQAPNYASATTTAKAAMETRPYLQYKINFVKKGDHYVWVRASHEGGGDDSYHIVLTSGDQILDSILFANFQKTPAGTNKWVWTHQYRDAALADYFPLKVNVPSVGVREIRICMREKLLKVDKIVLTTSSSYIPAVDTMGVGPAETVVGINDFAGTNGNMQSYPIPFSSNTAIQYNLKTADIVTIKVYNSLGQEVAVLMNEFQMQGDHQIDWDGNGIENKKLANGVYFIKLTCRNQVETIRTIISR